MQPLVRRKTWREAVLRPPEAEMGLLRVRSAVVVGVSEWSGKLGRCEMLAKRVKHERSVTCLVAGGVKKLV